MNASCATRLPADLGGLLVLKNNERELGSVSRDDMTRAAGGMVVCESDQESGEQRFS